MHLRHMHANTEAGHQPQENSYAFLIREQAARNAFSESFDLIKRMEKDGLQPRLRTYAPLLQGMQHTATVGTTSCIYQSDMCMQVTLV
jgi:Pentacotripeptide-repeat region of PRORP